MKTVAIVLAAGKSSRMGKNKLLIRLNGKRLIDHTLDTLEASEIEKIVVVLGYKPIQLLKALKSRLNQLQIVFNEKYEEGMTSSFKKGLGLIKNADAVLLVLGDQPLFDPDLINRIVNQLEKCAGNALIVSPIYEGKKGHPLLFSKELFKEILALGKNETIRDIVHRHDDIILKIEADVWTIIDIDTQDDVKRIKSLLGVKRLNK
jgi:molybdenum cofactor cytidylyltransferase